MYIHGTPVDDLSRCVAFNGSSLATMGTISMREETFHALLSDIVMSMRQHGFEHIIMIGDSGGNGRGMTAVAEKYTKEWAGKPIVAHVPDHYTYSAVTKFAVENKLIPADTKSDGLHDGAQQQGPQATDATEHPAEDQTAHHAEAEHDSQHAGAARWAVA